MYSDNNEVKSRLKALINVMKYALKKWHTKNYEASISECYQSVVGWQDDVEKIATHRKVTAPSFQSARNYLADAKSSGLNRDNVKTLATKAMEALETAISEIEEINNSKTKTRAKADMSFHRDYSETQGYEPSVFSELYEVKMALESELKTRVKFVDPSRAKQYAGVVSGIIERYPERSQISQAGERAVRHLLNAANERDDYHTSIKSAINWIDNMGAYAVQHYTPRDHMAAYKTNAVSLKRELKHSLDNLEKEVNLNVYEKTANTIRRVKSATWKLYKTLNKTERYDLTRKIKTAIDWMSEAEAIANQSSSIKAIDNLWGDNDIAYRYENALNYLAQVKSEISHL